MTLDEALEHCGLIAILRGITPGEIVPIAQALFEAGFRIVEVPLNSPDPYTSIRLLSRTFTGRMVVGAGTVLKPSEVDQLSAANGQIAVSPNCNASVIKRALELGIVPLPGVFTPTEAFAAIAAGARYLKLFPAETASPATVKAWRAVLPKEVKILAVGGVTTANMKDWLAAGTAGFGIGSSLYKPGMLPSEVATEAQRLLVAWKAVPSL